MPTLEIHALEALSPSLVNRDDQNMPKTAYHGGVRRARVSSQTWKRRMRLDFASMKLIPAENLSVRTRDLVRLLTDALATRGHDEDEALLLAVNTVWGMGVLNTDPKNKNMLANVLLFISDPEIQVIADKIHDSAHTLLPEAVPVAKVWPPVSDDPDAEPVESPSKAERKAACPKEFQTFGKPLLKRLDAHKAADIAVFGRFLAESRSAGVDGALSMAHAIGVDELHVDIDYYTAVDDLREESGFLDNGYLTAPVLYRYAALDLWQLGDNLAGDADLIETTIKAVLTTFAHSMPTGKHTSTAAYSRPDLLAFVLREDQPFSLASAFLQPVTPTDDRSMMDNAARALASYWDSLGTTYGHGGVIKAWNMYTGDRSALALPLPGSPALSEPQPDALNFEAMVNAAAGRAVLHLAAR